MGRPLNVIDDIAGVGRDRDHSISLALLPSLLVGIAPTHWSFDACF
jgi:hypothetical protein